MRGTAARQFRRALHPRPQHGVQVQRPADVVVVGALVAVGEPAVRADERIVQGEVGRDIRGRPRTADRPQEGLHHEPEPQPVRPRVRVVSDRRGEVVDDPLLRDDVQLLPQPRPGHVEDEGDGCRFDLGLGVLIESHPAVRSLGIDTARDSLCVEVDEVIDTDTAFSGDPETREKQGAGETFETIDCAAVAALGARERDPAVPLRGVALGTVEQTIGMIQPLLATPVRAEGLLVRRAAVLASHAISPSKRGLFVRPSAD